MTAVQRQLAPTDHLEIDSEENWDDDFEFQGDGAASNSGSRGSRRQRGPQSINQKLSIGSRAETEDWDAEQSTSVHLATSTATLKPPSPSRALRVPPDPETENWDDDFEDGGNSPQKSKLSPSFPPPRTSSLVISSHTEVHSEGVQEEPVESWDDDLDAEFGMADHEEEDRTVTARSRRAALSRAARMPGPSTPPPPTPKIPRGLAPAGAFLAPDQPFPHAQGPHSPTSSVFSVPATVRTTGSSAPLFASGSAHAYPSASARVFSLLPPSPQVHKERERRRLRKRSRPGDREDRERRREREGVFELVEVAEGSGHRSEDEEEGYRYGYGRSSIDSERDFEIEEEEEGRESAHGHVGSRSSVSRPFASRPSTAPTATQASQLQSVPATPTKQTLLSRIGSVKRWAGAGVRRKRGMSTGPDEIAGDPRHDALNELPDAHRTPRPHSSMSSFTNHDSSSGHGNGHVHSPGAHPRSPSSPATPSKSTGASPNADNGWFFRASSRSPPDSKRVYVSKAQGTRSVSRSTVDGPASVSPNSKSKAKASPSPRHISRSSSRSRAAVRDEGEDSLRASQRSGDRDAGAGWNGVGVGRRPGSRGGITGIGADAGRKGIRASLDFNASRTSLGMSMNILEAQERERERAREVYTPSPGVATPSRRAVGRGRGYSVDGKDQDGQTPAKLIKRKSLGFVQLRRATVGSESKEDLRDDTPEEDKESEGRQARYGGLGIGRAFGLGKAAVEGGEVDDNRNRRKSFSKLLKHRDPEEKDRPSILQTPPKVKEKEGSRGFMGSVRRISLVGKHKRTKSGSGFGLGSVPPSPSSPFFSRHASSGTPAREAPPLPYTLPSLAVSSSSQLSLRLAPSSSTHHLPLPPSRPGKRVVSTASSQGSSVMPASSSDASTSASSSRNPSASHSQMSPAYEHAEDTPKRTPQQVPATVKRTSSRRSRASEEGKRRPSLVSSRPSLDFEARIRRSIDQEVSTGAISTVHPVPPLPSGPLLPPIELQPPSPPQTIGLAASATGNKTLSREGETCAAEPPATTLDSLSPTNSSTSLFFTPKSSPHPPSSPKKLGISQGPGKSPGSPQSASLGRVTAATVAAGSEGVSGQGGASVPRRNSLGDLKIPARISQAQVGIKRDLGMVKEFATSVDQLKDLQQVYNDLVAEVQTIFEFHIQQHARQIPAIVAPRTTSPSFFANLTRPKSRIRSYTSPAGQTSLSSSPSLQDVTTAQLAYKEMAAAFYTINSKYRISWECAELLIELGGGAPATSAVSSASPPPTSASAQPLRQTQAAIFDGVGKKKSRERAITLAGDQAKPYPSASTSLVGSASLPTSAPYPDTSGPPPASPPNMSWRASTGRHDLSQRQLSLLRDMLNNANATSANDDSQLSIPEESLHALNKEWRWGDARNSTITLPSEESSAVHHERYVLGEKKRRTGVLGMVGIRDMLRALKRSHTEGEASLASPPSSATRTSRKLPKAAQSTTSLSTQSSGASKKHQYAHARLPSNRRRDRSSTGPDTVRASQDLEREGRVTSHANVPFVLPKPSARRPSLASIFRIGTKHRTAHMPSDEISIASPPTSATQVDEQLAQSSGTGEDSSSASEEEDWDRIESASDLGVASQALGRGSDGSATVRGGSQRQGKKGNSPYPQHNSFEPPPLPLPTPALSVPGQSMGYSLRHSVIPKRSFNASSSSLRNGEPPLQASPHGSSTHMAPRTIRLSNVEEHTDEPNSPGAGGPTPSSPTSTVHPNTNARHSTIAAYPLPASSIRAKAHKNGSVRSMPPQLVASATSASLQDAKLAMTPENINPLLENAKEVLEKLHECVAEIRALIEACDGQIAV